MSRAKKVVIDEQAAAERHAPIVVDAGAPVETTVRRGSRRTREASITISVVVASDGWASSLARGLREAAVGELGKRMKELSTKSAPTSKQIYPGMPLEERARLLSERARKAVETRRARLAQGVAA